MLVNQVQQLSTRGVGHEDVDVMRVLPVGEHLDHELASALGEAQSSEWCCRAPRQMAGGGNKVT